MHREWGRSVPEHVSIDTKDVGEGPRRKGRQGSEQHMRLGEILKSNKNCKLGGES